MPARPPDACSRGELLRRLQPHAGERGRRPALVVGCTPYRGTGSPRHRTGQTNPRNVGTADGPDLSPLARVDGWAPYSRTSAAASAALTSPGFNCPTESIVQPRTTVHTIVRRPGPSIVFGTSRFVDVPHRSPRCLYMDMTTTSAATTNHEEATRPLLISIAQAAAILAVSRSSIYQLIWNEQLTPIRIGRTVRFTIEHVEDFVARRVAESRK